MDMLDELLFENVQEEYYMLPYVSASYLKSKYNAYEGGIPSNDFIPRLGVTEKSQALEIGDLLDKAKTLGNTDFFSFTPTEPNFKGKEKKVFEIYKEINDIDCAYLKVYDNKTTREFKKQIEENPDFLVNSKDYADFYKENIQPMEIKFDEYLDELSKLEGDILNNKNIKKPNELISNLTKDALSNYESLIDLNFNKSKSYKQLIIISDELNVKGKLDELLIDVNGLAHIIDYKAGENLFKSSFYRYLWFLQLAMYRYLLNLLIEGKAKAYNIDNNDVTKEIINSLNSTIIKCYIQHDQISFYKDNNNEEQYSLRSNLYELFNMEEYTHGGYFSRYVIDEVNTYDNGGVYRLSNMASLININPIVQKLLHDKYFMGLHNLINLNYGQNN